MRRLAPLLFALLLSCSTTLPPLVVEQVNAHLWRMRQPQSAAEWQQVARVVGPGAVDVKLNDPGEGPAGYSDDYAATVGLDPRYLAVEPKGDGPLAAQVDGVFREPDEKVVSAGELVACDPGRKTVVHCTHGWDRTGYFVARERVACEGWDPERAEDEWRHHAMYFPYGTRVESPGLWAAWHDFLDRKGLPRPRDPRAK